MSLFVSDTDLFEIVVKYERRDGALLLDHPDAKNEERFWFKRPNWAESKAIMSQGVIVDGNSGQAIIDPYKLMDMKMRTLLKKWTLKGQDGEAMEVSPENLAKLDPLLVQHLYSRVEEQLSPQEKKA